MKVRELMTLDVRTISIDCPLADAAQLMERLDVGALPVVDGERLAGLVTDRDIAIRGVAAGRAPEETTAGDVMSPNPIGCHPDTGLEEVARLMRTEKVRRLPIIDEHEHVVGMIALGDLATTKAGSPFTQELLASVSA